MGKLYLSNDETKEVLTSTSGGEPMIEVHLSNGGGVIRLQRVGVGYYQVVYTRRTGETIHSPLFQDAGAAVKWAISLMNQIAASPSLTKAGT